MTDVGRRVGSAITDAGDAAVKYLDNEQISKGAKDFSSLMLSSTQAWNATVKNADPNDPTVAAKFMAGMQPQLDQFKSGFYTEEGQKWAESHADALRQHLQEKTVGDMASLAGEAAVVNHQQTINQLSATVHGDSSSLDFALAALKSSTEGIIASNPNLTGAKANEVRTELLQKGSESIVKAAAIGYIDKTAKMPDWATDPKYAPYINGAELQMFEKSAQAQAKVNALTEKQTELVNRQINERKAESQANKLMADNVKIDPGSNRLMIGPDFFKGFLNIAKMPDAPVGLARTGLDWGSEHQNQSLNGKADLVDDPAVVKSLTDRMFDPEKPTTKWDLMKAQVDSVKSRQGLSNETFKIMEQSVDARDKMPADPVFKFAMDGTKEMIEGRTPGEKSLQVGKYAAFQQQFFGEYQRQRAAGTLPPNALNLSDPNSLISKMMEPYKSPLAAAIGGNGGISVAPSGPSNVPPPATAPKYNTGDVVNTSEGPRRFKGGNFRDKANWEPAS